MSGQGVGAPISRVTMQEGDLPVYLAKYLTLAGDGTGSINVIGNYSTPEIVYLQPPPGTVYLIDRMTIYVKDVGSCELSKYGADPGGISPGWTLRLQDDSGTIHDFVHYPVLKNEYFGMMGGGSGIAIYALAGDSSGAVFGSLPLGSYNNPVRVDGSLNQRLEVIIQGNYSTLKVNSFLVYGYIE